MDKICVCGAGTMGAGIAQLAAQQGFRTVLFERDEQALRSAQQKISVQWQTLVDKNKWTEEQRSASQANLDYTSDIDACRGDVMIEAITERIEAKTSLLIELYSINESDCLFASNTSSLSIDAIATQLPDPSRFLGMHFFNPAPLMKLVEIVRGTQTAENTMAKILQLATALGKTPVVCRDSPGFIVNRVARPYYLESLRLVEEGLLDFASIDELLEATGFKMGPFHLMDLIGNDINFTVSQSVYEQLGRPERLKPSSLQQDKVANGELGRKTGKGYFDYPSPKS